MTPGTKQGQDVYLAGPSPPSFLHNTRIADPFFTLMQQTYECRNRVDYCCQLIIVNSLPVADMCTTAPDWFWFGLLLLRIPNVAHQNPSRPQHPPPLYSGTTQGMLRKGTRSGLDNLSWRCFTGECQLFVRTLMGNCFGPAGPEISRTLGESTGTRLHSENPVRISIHSCSSSSWSNFQS
jgi:hypothetical protein